MGRLTNSLAKAADHAERLSAALKEANNSAGGGGGAGGGGSAPEAPTTINFNTTVVTPTPSRTISGGTGGVSGTGGRPSNGDSVSRAFAELGLSSVGKSYVFIKQIVDEFLRRTRGNGGVDFRASGGG